MRSVLLAEDDRPTQLRLCSFLKDWGYETTTATDGLEAWNLFQAQEFDVVISDWMMPNMDGLELVRRIRNRKQDNYVYVILLTARTDTRNLVEGMEAGADDFVTKPFEKDELRVRVRAGQRVIELERSLAQRNQELSMFTSVASHDLREPLRTISSYLMLLDRKYRGKLDEQADEFISFTTDAAARMMALITDLLSFARLDTRPADFEEIDTAEVCADAVVSLRKAIEECDGTVNISPDLPTIRSNRVYLNQLFQNLIGNGIKYRGDDAPVVEVGVTRDADSWLFCVRDNGIGIPADQRTSIFEPFRRLHGVGGKYQGSGVGLAICKKVVDKHGGRIWVESSPDGGSAFHVSIPKMKNADNG